MPLPAKKILFVTLIDAYWGGSEILWSQAARELLALGHHVTAYFGYYRNIPEVHALARSGCRVEFGTPPPTRWWKRLVAPPPIGPEKFLRTLDEQSPDLVVFSQGCLTEGVALMNLCQDRGVPYAVVNQLMIPWDNPDLWQQTRRALSAAARVWFVSIENLEQARDWLCLPLENAAVTENPSAHPIEDLPWPDETQGLRIACIGRQHPPQKGQDLLIDAWARLAPPRAHLSIFTPGDKTLLRARAEFKNCPRLTFHDGAKTAAEIWRHHHALVLPSRYEGCALVMIEAMCHARPVLVTPVGGVRGRVEDGVNGFVAPSVSVEGLHDLLARALQQPSLWPGMGQAAKASIAALHRPPPARAFATAILHTLDLARK